jgi:hypothetical protein
MKKIARLIFICIKMNTPKGDYRNSDDDQAGREKRGFLDAITKKYNKNTQARQQRYPQFRISTFPSTRLLTKPEITGDARRKEHVPRWETVRACEFRARARRVRRPAMEWIQCGRKTRSVEDELDDVFRSAEMKTRLITRNRVFKGGNLGEGEGEGEKGEERGGMPSAASLAPDLDGTVEDKRRTAKDIIFLLLTTFDKMQLEV